MIYCKKLFLLFCRESYSYPIAWIFLVLLLYSCNKGTIEFNFASLSYSFFPLQRAYFNASAIAKTSYSPEITSCQNIEDITGTHLYSEKSYLINRFSRLNEREVYEHNPVWNTWQNRIQAVWNTIALNNLGEETCLGKIQIDFEYI